MRDDEEYNYKELVTYERKFHLDRVDEIEARGWKRVDDDYEPQEYRQLFRRPKLTQATTEQLHEMLAHNHEAHGKEINDLIKCLGVAYKREKELIRKLTARESRLQEAEIYIGRAVNGCLSMHDVYTGCEICTNLINVARGFLASADTTPDDDPTTLQYMSTSGKRLPTEPIITNVKKFDHMLTDEEVDKVYAKRWLDASDPPTGGQDVEVRLKAWYFEMEGIWKSRKDYGAYTELAAHVTHYRPLPPLPADTEKDNV